MWLTAQQLAMANLKYTTAKIVYMNCQSEPFGLTSQPSTSSTILGSYFMFDTLYPIVSGLIPMYIVVKTPHT